MGNGDLDQESRASSGLWVGSCKELMDLKVGKGRDCGTDCRSVSGESERADGCGCQRREDAGQACHAAEKCKRTRPKHTERMT